MKDTVTLFQLNPDGYKKDSSLLTVILHEEDHTIGNSVKHILCGMYVFGVFK